MSKTSLVESSTSPEKTDKALSSAESAVSVRKRFPFRRSLLTARFDRVERRLPELLELEEIIEMLAPHARVEVLARVQAKEREFPLYALSLGSTDPKAPVFGLFGGVHGLERIGTHVVLAYMHTLAELLTWDETLHERLKTTRLILMPLVNPGGMYLRYRSNPQGVDLMRNAPVEAEGDAYSLLSGHRISKRLAWYRGEEGAPMEVEAQALCDFVRREVGSSPISICLDVHSGFGVRDRLWFPYAKTTKPFPSLAEFSALSQLFDRTYPNHFYQIEPQAQQYTTHGDLWDYLYDQLQAEHPSQLFLPLCLEMGSWMWVKKNPAQIFSLLGPFNPLKPHRHQRILRRHMTLLDFLHRSLCSHQRWSLLEASEKMRYMDDALQRWYANAK